MTAATNRSVSRRSVVRGGAALAAASAVPTGWAIAQAKPLKVGLMLPYSGTFAKLGENITFAIELLIAEKGGKLGGREIQIVKLDDESKPENAPQNADRLVKRDQVDVLIGTVHSGVQMGIHKVVSESGTLTIVPNAGNVAVTRDLCAKNVFRSSFTNWQPAYGMGVAAAKKGYKKGVWVTWDYAAGAESGAGFKEGVREGRRPGAADPRRCRSRRPTSSRCWRRSRAWASTWSARSSPAAAPCSSSRSTRPPASRCRCAARASSPRARSRRRAPPPTASRPRCTTATGSTTPRTPRFRKAFKDKAGRDADVYAVQGYDAAQLLAIGLEAVKGNIEDEANLYKALRAAKIDSPRGPISMSPAQNVTQNIYLRKAEGGQNKVVGIAAENLADPGTGCKLA